MAPTDRPPLLAATNVTGGYGRGQRVLNGASVEVAAGEMVAVIGPNGAGKSTFLRALFGMCVVDGGEIRLSGERIEHLPPDQRLARGISLCMQGRCNFSAMTVRDNLELGGYTLAKRQVAAEVERVMQSFPVLARKQRQLAGTMSGGEQQQLEMATALMLRPKILLIDEPSLGLDPKNVDVMFQSLEALRTDDLGILMVEQNARRALRASNRAVVIEQGRTVKTGAAEAILDDQDVQLLYLGGILSEA